MKKIHFATMFACLSSICVMHSAFANSLIKIVNKTNCPITSPGIEGGSIAPFTTGKAYVPLNSQLLLTEYTKDASGRCVQAAAAGFIHSIHADNFVTQKAEQQHSQQQLKTSFKLDVVFSDKTHETVYPGGSKTHVIDKSKHIHYVEYTISKMLS